MDAARLHEVFKLIGKAIYLSDLSEVYASGVKSHLVNTWKQSAEAAGDDELYDDMTSAVQPLIRNVQPLANTLDRTPAIAKAGIESYLRVLGPELGTNAQAPVPLLTALSQAMTAAAQTVAPSGAFWSYVFSTWGAQLPSAASPTIPDAWITTMII